MRLSAAALVLSVISVTPALAQEASDRPFEGVTVTAIAGADLRFETRFVYGGQLGYDWQRDGTVFGVEAEATGVTDSERCYAHITSPTALDRLCGKAGRDLYIGGRIGRVVGGTNLLYLKAGYANVRSDFSYQDGGSGTNDYSGSDIWSGVRAGAGVEKAVGRNVLIKAEYRYSDYAEGYSRHQAMAGIGLRF